MRNFGFPELLVVLGILILLFGIGRLGKIGAELGKGIRSFRQALSEEEVEEENTEAQTSKEQA